MAYEQIDYYEVLGVTKSDDADAIKKAFRRKAREFHPDVNDAPDAEDQFKKINEAYDVLSDPQKKAQYDQFGSVGGPSGYGNSGGYQQVNIEDLFGDLFSSFFGGVSGEQEPERAAPRSGIVDHLGYQQVVVAEVELVADADLAGGIYNHVPQQAFAVEFAQQEHLDLGAGLFLVAPHAGRKYLGVVHHEGVALIEIVEDVLEFLVLDLARFAVHHHQLRAVAVFGGVQGDEFFGDFELE